jgi:hypothetical protein
MNIEILSTSIKNDLSKIDNILKVIRHNEYSVGNYVPEEIVVKKCIISDNVYEVKKFKSVMAQNIKKKNQNRSQVVESKYELSGNFINILNASDSIFNRVDVVESSKWKDLSIDDKVMYLDVYFIYKYINIDMSLVYNELVDLINKNKFYSKQHIVYDRVNRKIINIPVIKYDNNDDVYVIKFNNPKKKITKILK